MRASRGPVRGGLLGVWLALVGCAEPQPLVDGKYGSARLTVQASAPTEPSTRKGKVPLGGEGEDLGFLWVPEAYQPGTPAALVVLFHGARSRPEGILEVVKSHADATGTLVLAPKSADISWDLILQRQFGPDVGRLDGALARVFREYSVDPERTGTSGFSDGATYALSVGLSNGDLFRRISAFSPGGAASSGLQGRPEVFISHGTHDGIIPPDAGGRYVAEQLREEGYTVRYHEFAGTHTVPSAVAETGFTFLAGPAH